MSMSKWSTAGLQWVALALLLSLSALTSSASGQGDSQPLYGGAMRGMTQITGTLVCADCSLEQARRANPELHDLSLFKHDLGQAVIQVN